MELAVKCAHPHIFAKKQRKQDFMREAVNWVQLGLHPHVVTCHYVRMMGGIPHLIRQLQYAGYGWLRPEGVRIRLQRMGRVWRKPPALIGGLS